MELRCKSYLQRLIVDCFCLIGPSLTFDGVLNMPLSLNQATSKTNKRFSSFDKIFCSALLISVFVKHFVHNQFFLKLEGFPLDKQNVKKTYPVLYKFPYSYTSSETAPYEKTKLFLIHPSIVIKNDNSTLFFPYCQSTTERILKMQETPFLISLNVLITPSYLTFQFFAFDIIITKDYRYLEISVLFVIQ